MSLIKYRKYFEFYTNCLKNNEREFATLCIWHRFSKLTCRYFYFNNIFIFNNDIVFQNWFEVLLIDFNAQIDDLYLDIIILNKNNLAYWRFAFDSIRTHDAQISISSISYVCNNSSKIIRSVKNFLFMKIGDFSTSNQYKHVNTTN